MPLPYEAMPGHPTRTLPIILTDDVAATRDFYRDLLGFEVAFDSDWFVNLTAPGDPEPGKPGTGNPGGEIGVWRRDHELVPSSVRQLPQGVIVNVVVDDVDLVHGKALAAGLPIVRGLRDEGYGQRRFLTMDPAGTVVDVSTPIPMSEEFLARMARSGG